MKSLICNVLAGWSTSSKSSKQEVMTSALRLSINTKRQDINLNAFMNLNLNTRVILRIDGFELFFDGRGYLK